MSPGVSEKKKNNLFCVVGSSTLLRIEPKILQMVSQGSAFELQPQP